MEDNNIIYERSREADFLSFSDKKEKDGEATLLVGENKKHVLQIDGCFSADTRTLRLIMLFDLDELYKQRNIWVKNFYGIFLMVLLLGAALSFFISRWLMRTTRHMVDVIQGLIIFFVISAGSINIVKTKRRTRRIKRTGEI